MVQWQDRGFVGDSDDDEEFFDLEADRNYAAPGTAIGQAAEESERQDINIITETSRSEQGAVEPADNEKIAEYKAEDSSQRSNFVDARSVQSTPAKAHAVEHDTPITSPTSREANKDTNHDAKRPSLDFFDIPSSPLTELDSQSPIEPNRFTPPPRDLTPFSLPQVVVNIPEPRIDGADQALFGESQAEEEGVIRTDIGGRAFRPRTAIQLHPYLLESEQYRRSLQARGLRPIAVSNGDSQALANAESNESQLRESLQEQSSQSSSFQASTPSVARSVENSPILRPGGFTPDQRGELPNQSNSGEHVREGVVSVGHKKRRISHTYGQSARSEARRILESNPMFQLSPSPELSPSKPTQAQSKQKHRKPKLYIPKSYSPPPLPTPLTSSIRRKPWRVISDDESSDDDLMPDARHVSAASPADDSGSRDRIARRTSSAEGSQSSSEEEPDKERERAAIDRYRKKLKGVLPASWLRIDQQIKPLGPSAKRNIKQPQDITDRTGDRKGVARPLPRSHPHTPASGKVQQVPTQEIVEISDQSDQNQDQGMLFHDDGEPVSSLRTQDQLHIVQPIRDVEEDNWIDPMLPSVLRPRKITSTKRKRQTRLTDNFASSAKLSVGGKEGRSNAEMKTHEGTAIESPKHEHVHRKRRRSSQKVLPKLSLLDVLEDDSQGTKRPDFLRVARRSARSTKHTGKQEPSRKQMYFRNRNDGHDAGQLLHAWRSGNIKSRIKSSNHPSLARKQRTPLTEQQTNGQRHTAKNPTYDQVKTPRVISAGSKELPRAAVTFHQPQITQLMSSTTSHTHNSTSHERTQEDAGNLSKSEPKRQHDPSRKGPRGHERRGQLEELQTEEDYRHPRDAFRRNLLGLDVDPPGRLFDKANTENPLLARYLHDTGFQDSTEDRHRPKVTIEPSKNQRKAPVKGKKKFSSQRNFRKIQPIHVDTDDFSVYRGRTDEAEIVDVLVTSSTSSSHHLQGLAPPGHFYPITFSVSSLPRGVYFHRQSFIGSGELMALVNLKNRDLDTDAGFATISYRASVYKWGPWTEDVASQISTILAALPKDLDRLQDTTEIGMSNEAHEVTTLLRDLLRYFVSHLHFSDPIDRRDFVGRSLTYMHEFLDDLSSSLPKFRRSDSQQTIWMLSLSLWYAIIQICDHGRFQSTSPDIRMTNDKVVELLKMSIMTSFDGLSDALGQQNIDAVREKGIQGGDLIDTWCSVVEVLHRASVPGMSFWDCFNYASNCRVPQECYDVREFELLWRDVFHLLPIRQMHASTLSDKSSSHDHSENWTLVKRLIVNIGDKYSRPGSEQPRINSYIRALEGRCFHLVKHWHWQRPEPALNCLFDFFARRSLYLLSGEEATDTSMLLEKINGGEHLQTHSSDHSFTLFLKMLRISLLSMRQIYTAKKIRNITWRFVPNHGRIYRKEEDLRRDDLEALRNHHDLLSLLYASSPPDARPKPTLLQNLVDLKSSHSEVCRLHIKTWANLVIFQLNTDESPTDSEPFSHWFNSIMHDLMLQHRAARAEAEEMFHAATTGSVAMYSRKLVDKTVGSNERQIEALMSTALSCLKDLVSEASNEAAVSALIEKIDFKQIFCLLDQKHVRLGRIIGIAVEVAQCYFKHLQKPKTKPDKQEPNDDSQDYGGWPSDDDDVDDNVRPCSEEHVNNPASNVIAADIQQLLSNCFGADTFGDLALLEKVTVCWASIATLFVQQKRHDWFYYLAIHGQGSWSQLLETENRAKFYPLYLANIIESDSSVLIENKNAFLEGWLVSLLERESLMKYQHTLTTSLLNGITEEPLLYNLPFESLNGQHYDIKLEELKDRRISLLSSVLGNMRSHIERSKISGPGAMMNQCRQTYAQVLQQMMTCMKKNYQALGTGSSLKGAYVEFVHSVVECLQQYTTEICPIDKFFTDSAAFPLPTNDPLYVVGRLRSYGAKPRDPRNQKKLAVFIQTVVERAVADSEQGYLTEQLVTAMNSENENGAGLSSLRWIFLEGIVPAYIDWMHTDGGCLLALPILASIPAILGQSVFHLDFADISCCERLATNVFRLLLQGFDGCQITMYSPRGPKEWAFVYLLQAAHASLPLLDFLSSSNNAHFLTSLSNIISSYIASRASTTNADLSPLDVARESVNAGNPGELRIFAKRQLDETLKKSWKYNGSRYLVKQGNNTRFVEFVPTPPRGTIETILTNLRHEITELLDDVKPYACGASKLDFIDNLVV